jgi:hypothetical protein
MRASRVVVIIIIVVIVIALRQRRQPGLTQQAQRRGPARARVRTVCGR